MSPAPRDPIRVSLRAACGDAVLEALKGAAFGPFVLLGPPAAGEDAAIDVLVAEAADADDALSQAGSAAVVLRAEAEPTPTALTEWMRRGAQDVILPGTPAAQWPLRLLAALARRRHNDDLRRAVGIDLATGLPDQQQLVEHMSHLLALRTREPAPMAVLVLRVEGLASAQARFGREAAQVLRRKLAVRLRAGVRASDVVASIGEDRFAVLLASMLAATDAQRVADKLLAALAAPVPVAGQALGVAVALGIGQVPDDGDQPEPLLARATARAAAALAQGRSGFANFSESGPASAANDA